MNERIRELARQAGIKITTMVVDGIEYEYEDVEMDGSEDLEKFAELIVRECVQVCADRGKMHDGLYSAWADDCSKRIGKHFGVEE